MSRCKLWSRRSCGLVLLALLACGLPVTSQAAARAQDAQVRLRCRIEPTPLTVGGAANLIVEVLDVQNLYGYELMLTYNAQQVQVQDADAQKADVNLDLSNALVSPDFVVYNRAADGTISLALTQLAPNSAKSGSGELARAPFVAAAVGVVAFTFSAVTLSDDNGAAITLTIENCQTEVTVAATPTVTASATITASATATATAQPTATATAVVTQPSAEGAAIPVATAIPTSAPPTNTPLPPTATFTPLSQPTDLPTSIPASTATPAPTVLAISTPTTQTSNDAVVPQSAETQPPAPSPTSLPATATPSVSPMDTSPAASTQSPTVPATTPATPSPSTPSTPSPAMPTEPPVAQETSISSQVVLPLIGQEMLSPAQLTTPQSENSPTSSAVVETTDSVTPAATATPLVIAQRVDSPRAQVIVQQPAPTASTRERLYLREAAWLSLLTAAVFALGARILRKP